MARHLKSRPEPGFRSRGRTGEIAEKRRLYRKGLCRWCLGAVLPPKITFCGPMCVHEWRLRSDQGYVRMLVKKRDHGVCAGCGAAGGYWEADHKVALEEGGGHDLSNLQTLCGGKLDSCHARKTREHAARRAERRRGIRVGP